MSSTTEDEVEARSTKFCQEHPPGVRVQYKSEKCPLCTASKSWTTIAEASLKIGLVFTQTALSGVPLSIAGPQNHPGVLGAAQSMKTIFDDMMKALGAEPSRIIAPANGRVQ